MADTTIANTAYEPMEVDVAKEPRRWVSAWNVKATILKYRVALFLSLAALVVVIILAATGVFSSSSNSSNSANSSDVAPTIAGNFTVFHAGSLVSLMDKIVAPAFLTASGYAAQLHAKGSVALANEIKNHSIADVFISADASVNTNVLMGSANGDLANWYVAFGRTSLGLGYSTASPYVDVFESVANGSLDWYDALMASPNIKIGRTDPDLDPKGYRTVMVMNLAEKHYNKTGLGATILGNATNRQQIFTEENLEKYVTAGDLDVGFFYEVEVSELSEVKFLALPAEIDMSDPALNSVYASASYTNAKSGQVYNGSASVYTVTIPTTANHTAAATSFVKYLISEAGQNLLVQHGMKKTTLTAYPNKSAVPAEIAAMLP